MQSSMKITAIKISNPNDERLITDFFDETSRDLDMITDGSFSGKRNDVDSLVFTILSTHPLFHWLTPLETLIYFNKGNRWEFCGRIQSIENQSNSSGLSKKIVCESMEALLNDFSNMSANDNLGSTPKDTIKNYVDKFYNPSQPQIKKISHISFDDEMYKYTDFVMNMDTGKKATESIFSYLNYVNATMNIRRYDPEIDPPGLKPADLVMNVYHKDSKIFKVNQPIEIGVNMKEVSSTIDATELSTFVRVNGKVENEKPIVFFDYENLDATKKYGKIIKTIDKSDFTKKSECENYAKEYSKLYSVPQITLACKPIDLSFIKKNLDAYKVGNIVRVINTVINIDEELYIEELSYSLMTYYDVTVTVANKKQNYLNELLRM